MLELSRGLSPAALTAISDLEKRTVHADGGRLKLEWGVLRSRTGRDVEDLMWWDGDRLLGFLGLYGFAAPDVELAGMVDPAARRRGIGTALLDAALPLCGGYARALLVTPRDSAGGRALALGRHAVLDRSEYALVLTGAPADGPTDPAVALRPAVAADVPDLVRVLTAAFGSAHMPASLDTATERTLVVEAAGRVAGTLRRTLEGEEGGVYGFAVDPALQGRGIGRDVLRRVCWELLADGARRVGLEVEVQNEHALGLYTSLGFTRVTTEDYYALPRRT